MTVNSSQSSVVVAGNGASTSFSFPFIGVAPAYITVLHTTAAGVQTALSQGPAAAQFQVSLNAAVSGALWGLGGTVTYNPGSPIPSGDTLTISRALPLLQTQSLSNQGNLSTLASSAEKAVDLVEMQQQQTAQLFGYAIVANPANLVAPLPLPPAAIAAGQGLAFDSTGNNVIAGAMPSSGVISTAMQPVVSAASLALGQAAFGLQYADIYCTATVASNVWTLTPLAPNAAPAAYFDGQRFLFKASASSTGAVSAVFGALPQYEVFNAVGQQAGADDILSGWTYAVEYNSTINGGSPGFQLLDRPVPASIYFNVVAYGAVGDASTDDAAAIQAAFNAAQIVGGCVFFPPASGYKITTTLTATSRISILGVGYQGDNGDLYNNVLFAQSSGFLSSAIIPNGSFNAISLAANSAFMVEKIQITYPSQPTSGTTGIAMGSGAGSSCNMGSVIRDVCVTGADIGISLIDCYDYVVDNAIILDSWTTSIFLDQTKTFNSQSGLSSSDATITHCTCWSGAVTEHILVRSGGGLRIVNNKLNAAAATSYGVLINPVSTVVFTIEPFFICDNSIEGMLVGIYFDAGATTNGTVGGCVIAGNQLFCTNGIQVSVGTVTAQWVAGLTIASNTININLNGSVGVQLDGVLACVIGSNVFAIGGGFTGTGVVLGTHVSTMKMGVNSAGPGVALISITTPGFPATNVAVTNTYPCAIAVAISGGNNTTAIAVNGATMISQPSGAIFQNLVINPADTITITYTGTAASWAWRAIMP